MIPFIPAPVVADVSTIECQRIRLGHEQVDRYNRIAAENHERELHLRAERRRINGEPGSLFT